MKRLTFDGNFCDIAQCVEVCEGMICEDEECSQKQTWERLKLIEDILGNDYDLDRLRELVQADREGRCFITPFVAMVEQSLMNGEMKPERDQRFNGRYAVVYFDPEKWKVPLIDICGAPYNKEEAEQRAQQLIREAAEKALEKEENRNG